MDVVLKDVSYWESQKARGSRSFKFLMPKEKNVVVPELKKILLDGVSIRFTPGSVTALHGYGDSNSAVISILSAQRATGHISGSVLFDDSIRSPGAYCDIALCSKAALNCFFDLTVYVYLFWAARLRVSVSAAECSNRARDAAKTTGLDTQTKLGSLSTGQIRLLSIAAELVGNPTLLLLDDPLSGLDEINALQVVETLGRIARRQYASTTVVYSSKQPGHCLLRHVNYLVVLGGSKMLFSQDISALSLTPTMKLPDFHDVDRPDIDLRDIEIELSSLLDVIDRKLDVSESDPDADTAFANVKEDVEKLLSTYCVELRMNLSSYGLVETVPYDEDEDEETVPLQVRAEESNQSPLQVRRAEISNSESGDSSPSAHLKAGSPLLRELHAAGGHAAGPHKSITLSGIEKRRRILKQGFGGGFARGPKKTLEELQILIYRSKQNQLHNGWKLFFPFLIWVLSAVLLGVTAPNIGGEDATGEVGSYVNTSGETIEVEFFSVSSATFAVSVTPLLLLAFNVPYLYHQHVKLLDEVNTGLLNQVSVWLSVFLGDLPMYLLLSILFSGISYGMVGFQGSLGSFMTVIIAVTLCFYTLGMCCAAVATSTVVAGLYYLRLCAISIIFAGYYETIPNLSTFWKFFTFLSPSRWAFESLLLLMYDELGNADEYLELFGFDNGKVGTGITWLLVWFGILSVTSLLLMSPITTKLHRRVTKQKDKIVAECSVPNAFQSPLVGPKRKLYNQVGNQDSVTSPMSPHSPSPLLGYADSNQDLSSVLSFPEMRGRGDIESVTDNSATDGAGGRHLQRMLGQRSLNIGKIPAGAQMTLSFRQVSFTNTEAENTSSEESRSFLFANSSPFSLGSYSSFSNKAVNSNSAAPGSTTDTPSSREVLLEGITGKAVPGKICAIIDGSCEGSERILLRVLSGHAEMTGKVKGDICINGQPVTQGGRHAAVAFVPVRDPVTQGCLTVREAIRFAALLRRVDQSSCPCIVSKTRGLLKSSAELATLSKADRLIGKSGDVEDRVEDVIRLMGLSDVADTLIGERCASTIGAPPLSNGIAVEKGPMKGGISGAQMRCLTIGVELGLASGDRTLVCSVQSPPPLHVFDLFDDLLLIGRGLLVYSGPTGGAVSHFDNIGFMIRDGQSTVDFLLEIVGEQASLRSFGDKKGAMLSLEDLADLRKTMIDVGAKKHTTSDVDGSPHVLLSEELRSLHSSSAQAEPQSKFELVTLDPIAMGPAARVMAQRRWLTVYRSRKIVGKSFIRSFLVGCILGSMFFKIDDGNVTSRITLFSLVYLYLAAFVAEILPGAHRRQRDFLRERSVGSSVSLSYWLSDGAPSFAGALIQCFLLVVPLYPLVRLRPGFSFFMYFMAVVMTAAQSSMGLMYICSALSPNSGKSIGLYLGILLPIQYLFSGAVIYVDDMSYWLQWVPYVNPMHMFLSGVSYNEFSGNSEATGHNSDFDYVQQKYDFNTLRAPALFRLLFVALLYRVVWLLLLKLREIASEKRRLRRAMGAARRRARKLVTAGLRWRKSRQGYASGGSSDLRTPSFQGLGLVSVDNDEYTMINSTHASRPPVFSPKLSQLNEGDRGSRSYSANQRSDLSSDPSLASARFSSFFQEGDTPKGSVEHPVTSRDGRIKSRQFSYDDNLRV